MYHRFKARLKTMALVFAVGAASLALAGCERRERVLEIQTPEGGVSVDRVEEGDDTDRIEVHTDD